MARPSLNAAPLRRKVRELALKGLSQREIAGAVGIARMTLAKYFKSELPARKPRAVTPTCGSTSSASEIWLTPLQYMLATMNDPTADPARRDKLAIAAAPYVHSRSSNIGKKVLAELDAQDANFGTDWERLVN